MPLSKIRATVRWAALALAALALSCGDRASDSVGTPPAPSASGPVPPTPGCDPTSATDIEVSGADLDGFPPYAVGGCTLVYVSRTGDLVARDLASRAETKVAAAAERPRRPAASADLIAWEADEGGHSVVRVRASGVVRTVPGAFASSGEPRVNGSTVAFTAWKGPAATDDTDVWVFDAKTGESKEAIGGAGQQRFADISAKYVAVTDFSEDSDGTFDNNERDVADIRVLDRASGTITSRPLPGKQSFPMLGDSDVLAYLEWEGIHPEPKLVTFVLRTGNVLDNPTADRTIATVKYLSSQYARPALAGSIIEWVANPDGRTTLWRAPADGSALPVAVRGLDDLRLYAPAPTSSGTDRGFTVLATSRGASDSIPRLRAVAR
jgi:hypothetical protein